MAMAAQAGAVSGQVVSETGVPLAGARVSVPTDRREVATDAAGRFRIERLAIGQATITASAPGFGTARRTVEVRLDRTTEVRLVLTPIRTRLGAVLVREQAPAGTMRPASDTLGPLLVPGARTEVIALEGSDANLAEKVGRQIFARVPGLQVYDMDGAGNQTNVSTRGLDPHRSWEFNLRQDGVPINSDLYGYPASHYSLPMEAIERVELVRGTASLQYGSQFGGLLNYVTRAADTSRALAPRVVMNGGSFGLANLFGEASGRVGGVDYVTYAAWRESDGYRDGARSRYSAQYASATWHLTSTLQLRAQVARSWYLYRIPGPLTDAMFAADPRQSTRSRNWFSPTITIPALQAEWRPSERTRLSVQASGVLGDRSSVQFVGFATVADTVLTATGRPANRAVDIDDFDSRTLEVRLTHAHTVGARAATLAAGVTMSDNRMRRRQQGVGTTGDDYDLGITGAFGRDLRYRSRAVAAYAEEILRVTDRWTLIPGVRIERGETRMTGRLAYYDPADVPRTVRHDFPLLGLRTSYRGARAEWYGGWSESYRPMLLKDLLPENALERSDPAMRDARGWTAESGVRGTRGARLTYDVGLFWMRYDGRFGALLRDDGAGPYVFKTNLGSTRTAGAEIALDALLATSAHATWRGFASAALFDAVYRKGVAVTGGANVALDGNRVEGVPAIIVRTGVARTGAAGTMTLQVSHTGESFGDPLNTREPNVTGARGIVPAYTLVDLTLSRRVGAHAVVRAGVTNVFDVRYFTKRPAFYPGPGVWPSDGRGVTLGMSLGR
jgi:Fe(3+) dicitrate transport protein